MKITPDHSPLPWRAHSHNDERYNSLCVYDTRDIVVAAFMQPENAEFIVRACNQYYALKKVADAAHLYDAKCPITSITRIMNALDELKKMEEEK